MKPEEKLVFLIYERFLGFVKVIRHGLLE